MESKILSSSQLCEADQYTIKHEPISSVDLMERAATSLFDHFVTIFNKNQKIAIIVGSGNNGGDGLVLARLLVQNGYEVSVFETGTSASFSMDYIHNRERIIQFGLPLNSVWNQAVDWAKYDVCVDALFGSGLNRPVEEPISQLILDINRLAKKIVAIDIPSGLFAEENNIAEQHIIKAHYTFTFQTTKLAFLFPENEQFIGHYTVIDIGLHPDFMQQVASPFKLLLANTLNVQKLNRSKFAHKGSFGHVGIFAGSPGKMGASLLCSKACLSAGAGLVTALIPETFDAFFWSSAPEIMTKPYAVPTNFQAYNKDFPFTVMACGPGIGTDLLAYQFLKNMMSKTSQPMVLDADALTLLAKHHELWTHLPKNSILTPHLKELERLIGRSDNHYDRIKKTAQLAQLHQVYILIKGANSCVVSPDGTFYFNTTGNSAMATAGSGDVLTGIVAGFLSQGLNPFDAVCSAVYIHGMAGDIAVQHNGHGLIASHLIQNLGLAIQKVLNFNSDSKTFLKV